MSACLKSSVLARIAMGDGPVDPLDQQHAEQCVTCQAHIAFLRGCIETGTGIDGIADEVDEVIALFAELKVERPARWHRVVHSDPRFHRPALARRMIVLALAARGRDTKLALAYSHAVTTIVEALAPHHRDIGDLRFDAWRYHSMLLREIGDYVRCREAFVVADDAAEAATDPELSRAIILLSRALLAIEPDVWEPEEGLALLTRAEGVFRQRSPHRLLTVAITRGMLTLRAGDPEEAAAIFEHVLSMTPRDHEVEYAEALGNYLWAVIYAGGVDEDIARQIDALENIHQRRGEAEKILRPRWMRGLVKLAAGNLDDAVTLLRDAMRGYDAKGHADTAIRAGVDAVRALLTAERYAESVELARDLASRAAGLDLRDPTRRRSLTALAMSYLRDAARHNMLTPDLAASVGKYIDTITNQRPFDFNPPMPLHAM